LQGEGHSVVGWLVCRAVDCGSKVCSLGQWAAANCATPPTANDGQYATSNCNALVTQVVAKEN